MFTKSFKTKKVLKFSKFIFFTVYRVRGAAVGENLMPIGEYSSTVKKGENARRYTVVSSLRG